MYTTLILPYISYGILSWGHVNTNRLLLLQKRVVRILCRANYAAHTSALFARQNILKIADIFNLNVGKLMYNHTYSTVPIDISNQLVLASAMHSHNTRISERNNYFVQRDRTSLSQKSVFSYAVQFWNSLIPVIRVAPSLKTFTWKLKRNLINAY